MMLWLVFLACATDVDSTDDPGSVDSAPEPWVSLPTTCVAPTELGDDPITAVDSFSPSTMGALVELVDIELSDGIAYTVGQGGLLVFDATPGAATPLGGVGERFHRVEPIGAGFVAVTHRDRGLTVVDVRDPESPTPVATMNHPGWEGLSYEGGLLYVSDRGGIAVIDVSDPTRPAVVGTSEGLSAPWELSAAHDGWLYAADNALGIVPIDLSAPEAPAVGEPLALESALLHVTVADGWLYASAGGGGVQVFDLADPAHPSPVATLETGGSSVMTTVSDGLLYAVDHVGLTVWDVTEPASPVPVGRQPTPQFALGVAAADDVAWVADWTAAESWAVHREVRAPEAELSSSRIGLSTALPEAEVTVWNLGGADLHLTGATFEDPRVSLVASADTIAPGDSARLRVTFADTDGAPLDTTGCLATDDPDGPLVSFTLGVPAGDRYLGQPAPDFVLPGLDGQSYRLSEQLGHPVMLAYFATW